jgi:hypothetical protein
MLQQEMNGGRGDVNLTYLKLLFYRKNINHLSDSTREAQIDKDDDMFNMSEILSKKGFD